MTVWIVLKNGKIDEVFDNEPSARHHYNSLVSKWSLVEMVRKEVKSF